MDYIGKPLGRVVPLTERNGAPRHADDKQIRIIRAAVESVIAERDSKVISQLEKVVQRFENGMSRLMETVEAFKSGEKDVAIANLVDSIEDDLPSVSRLKAAPSAVFTLTTTEIALQLGLKAQDVSFLLNRQGLNWVLKKPELWDQETYKRTKRRLWHPFCVKILREVLVDPNHDDRLNVSSGCDKVLRRCVLGAR